MLATDLGADLVSVDSMQVYRGMDIGTAKPPPDKRGRYHLIDLADPEEEYSVAQFQAAGRQVLASLEAAGRAAVIVGGSGLHFRALVDPLEFPPTNPVLRRRLEATDPADLVAQLLAVDPDAATAVDLANPRRVLRAVEYVSMRDFVAFGVDPGDALRARVTHRCDAMLDEGLLEEVAGLRNRLGPTAAGAVGYKELMAVVEGDEDLAPAREHLIAATMALAKRQRTFFRRDPRINWLVWHDDADARLEAARAVLKETSAWNS